MFQKPKRITLYMRPSLHRALRLKSIETDESISAMVNEAVAAYLAKDADELKALESGNEKPSLNFGDTIRRLRADGEI